MLLKHELFLNKQISSPSIMHCADGIFEDLESNNERYSSILLSLSVLGNILTLSSELRISLSGKLLLFISSIKI